MIIQAAEKRRLPRFHITPCQFHDAQLNKNFSVQDISNGGLSIRLIDRSDLAAFAVGTEHKGVVKVEGLKTEAQFKVRYIRGTLIGGEWLSASRVLIEHLEEISQPDALGKHLRKYELPELAGTIWYHNPVGVDLLFYQAEDAVLRWTLYIHQSFVQWEPDTGVRTGRAVAEDEEGYAHGIVQLETRLIEYDEHVDRRLIESALELMQNAPIEKTELKTRALEQLKALIS